MEGAFRQVKQQVSDNPLLWGFYLLVLISVLGSALLQTPFPFIVPIAVVILAWGMKNLRVLLFSCLALIPFSTEVQIGSLGTDLPSEPLMMMLAGIGLIYLIIRAKDIDGRLLRHPITLALLLHFVWLFLASLTSTNWLTSTKFLVAKVWYVVPFFFMASILITSHRDIKQLIKYIAWPLTIVLIYCLVRHAALGFTFADVNKAMYPFFRNHVSYAALTSIALPYMLIGAWFFRKGSIGRWLLLISSLICLAAIQTSYTRAAYGSLLIGAGFILVIHFKLTKPALLLATFLAVAFGTFVVSQNRFFNFAPDYNKTITHTDFSNLLEATTKLEDISTMERVYRWVAGGYMAAEKPLMGFGPGTFYDNYKGYALESFRTYVSDNPEKSGIHNYYLMTLVEQGWPGLIIFILLVYVGLLTAERAFHKAKNRSDKLIVSMLAASLAINLSFQLINDMVETDKAGPWFFLALALLVNFDLKEPLKSENEEHLHQNA